MSYDYREKKITAIISKDLPRGLAMNALGHLAYSAGHYASDNMMGQEKIVDANGDTHTGISKYPFIVLQATTDEIKNVVAQAKKNNVFVVDYPQAMFDTGPDDELVEHLSKAKDITYHATVLVGTAAELKTLTGHLKLMR